MNGLDDTVDFSSLDGFPASWISASSEDRLLMTHESARKQGLKYSLEASIDVGAYIDASTPSVFGPRWYRHFSSVDTMLSELFKEDIEDFLKVSVRTFLYSKRYGEIFDFGHSFINQINSGAISLESENLEAPVLTMKPRLALLLLSYMPSEKDPLNELFDDTPFFTPETARFILYAMGLIWFFRAGELYATDVTSAFNMLYEASQVVDHADAISDNFVVSKITKSASELAKRRHAENYALADYVRTYWRQNIDPALSAQKAAEEIIRARIVPLSHKKIAEIVSALRRAEAKRK